MLRSKSFSRPMRRLPGKSWLPASDSPTACSHTRSGGSFSSAPLSISRMACPCCERDNFKRSQLRIPPKVARNWTGRRNRKNPAYTNCCRRCQPRARSTLKNEHPQRFGCPRQKHPSGERVPGQCCCDSWPLRRKREITGTHIHACTRNIELHFRPRYLCTGENRGADCLRFESMADNPTCKLFNMSMRCAAYFMDT